MKYLILILMALVGTGAFADIKALTWSGNNPPGSVNYVIEINRTNQNDESAWATLVVIEEETYTYDELTFGRTYYRVWAETKAPDPDTGDYIRSDGPSNVASTVVKPNDPNGLGVGG